MHLAVPRFCLLLQQFSEGTDPGKSLLPVSNHPPTSFSCHLLVILCHRSQPKPCFELSSLLPSNHELPDSSEIIYRSGGCHQPPAWSTCICTSYTYLSLGFYFHHDNVALESMGHFSESWLSRSETVSHFWKMQNQCCGHTLFKVMQKPSKDEWGKTLDATEATMVLEKNWPFQICMLWVVNTQSPISVTS